MNPAFLGSLTECKHVRVFSEVLKRLSVLLGFLNLHDFSLKKAQISLHLEINSHLVEECNIPWHWLFVISLTQTNSDCNLETFVEWSGVSHQRGDKDIVYWFYSLFFHWEVCDTGLGNMPCLACRHQPWLHSTLFSISSAAVVLWA